MTKPITFENDDTGYLGWMATHPEGFVINHSPRSKSGKFMLYKLHRTNCSTISTPNRGNWTTTQYRKTCSDNKSELKNWAMEKDKIATKYFSECKTCNP